MGRGLGLWLVVSNGGDGFKTSLEFESLEVYWEKLMGTWTDLATTKQVGLVESQIAYTQYYKPALFELNWHKW